MPPSPSLSGAPPAPVYPLYNTTYTLHRLSPLHAFTPSSLPSHAAALSEILTGSTLRGVRIGLDTSNASLSRAGALRSVSMRPLRSPDGWAAVHAAAEPDEIPRHHHNRRGIHTPPPPTNPSPPPLRTTLLDFLSTRFDTRASPMQLPSPFVKKAMGGYIEALVAGGGEVRSAVREVVISLAFPGVEGGELKNIDITISRDDIPNFLQRGGSSITTTTATSARTSPAQPEQHPFWTALHTYTTKRLALDLSNPSVAVAKIACGAFVIAAEGRVKISAPAEREGRGEREGAEGVLGMLVGVAERKGWAAE
ncbi:hypothetical protein VC83_06791 [Pseudogymnoascus destructans]|uniref:Uncharacterized protein n=1 Tax=Pseudogymnoascus destructans TaxID=655981 RepID=A0A177A5E1_9PEZI|nr:uncharacterized protein VC83_06791 [Pseudogymnoascus destructans]OAF56303.1 hypothetical protein VC83_06791 [Pseudogymnoascus destructans]